MKIFQVQNRLLLDMKGYQETAGSKWSGYLGPCRVCIWWRKSQREDEEEKVCLSVCKEEGLSKSRPILDRRSPHSITSYQPHITHLIYLPLPSHSSFPIASELPLFSFPCCFLFFSSPLFSSSPFSVFLVALALKVESSSNFKNLKIFICSLQQKCCFMWLTLSKVSVFA